MGGGGTQGGFKDVRYRTRMLGDGQPEGRRRGQNEWTTMCLVCPPPTYKNEMTLARRRCAVTHDKTRRQ